MLPLIKLKNSIATFTLFAFFLQLSGVAIVAQKTSNRNEVSAKKELVVRDDNEPRTKISPDLQEKSDDLSYGFRSDETQKVIIQLKSDTPLDVMQENDLSESDQKQVFADEVRNNRAKTGILMADLAATGGEIKKSFNNLGLVSAELPLSKIRELSENENVAYISPDRQINASGHVNTTTGADAVRAQTNASGGGYTLSGTGIGIAIIDSGMYSGHKSFWNAAGASRIKFSKDFTGENRVDDPFGHGTHVATAAAGYRVTGTSGNLYEGVAPNANLINLRVLNAQGTGTTTALLNALDWVMINKATYNIRVANLSLGTPAINSYTTDPLCIAVRRLVNAGIVVVAAAGNDGKSLSTGQKQYGTIHSPGNEPSAITVGATNTFGTDSRSDDIVTTYSSRGPTRSYRTDAWGVKHYDNLIKPDLVAPGNKLVYAQSKDNIVVTTYPNLNYANVTDNYRFMYMSGSSMATPIAAGAAALVLQANPNLRPNMVKMILSYTAQQLRNYNTLEQGAGQLNVEGAVRLAKAIKNLPSGSALGTALLTSTVTPTQQSTVAGTTFPWSQGIIMDHTYGKGVDLITKYQKIYDLGVLMSDGTTLTTSGVLMSDTTMMTGGVLLGNNILTSNGVVMGDGTNFMDIRYLLGNGVLMSDRSILGDGVLMSDGVLMADGILIGDNIDAQGVLVNGDNTPGM